MFAVPGDLATPTGGYAYDRRMIAELRDLGWPVEVLNLGDGFPRPIAKARERRRLRAWRECPPAAPIVIDGLAFGVLPDAAEALHASHPLVALVHHPLALETGVEPDAGGRVASRAKRAALARAQDVITTSAATARVLVADYGVPREQLDRRAAGHRPRRGHAAHNAGQPSRCSRSAPSFRARATTC